MLIIEIENVFEGVGNNWNIGWLLDGFKLLKLDCYKLDLNNELIDYYLYFDGFVEVFVFI